MFDHGLEYLKKKLPGFEDKPSPPPQLPAQTAPIKPQPAPQPPPRQPAQNSPPNANAVEMLDSLTSFLRQYLVCDPHELNVIVLWIVHTWCYQHFPTAAYLNICSAEPESGKTRCLELLNLLSNSPWLATGVLKGTIIDKLLNPGSQKTGRYILGPDEYCLFGPKAFASNVPLLPSLASRCITISLKRKKQSEPVRRFDRNAAETHAARLLAWLNTIGSNPGWITKKANETPPGLPKRLTPHEQDCAEPLIHIADAIGGNWPEKARNSIDMTFKLAPGTIAAELLNDLRVIFKFKQDPEYLGSRDILELLTSLEFRPWCPGTLNPGKKRAGLLSPFGIKSRNLQPEGQKPFKGYFFKDLKDAWERYAPAAEDVT